MTKSHDETRYGMNICDKCGRAYKDELVETDEVCPRCKVLAAPTDKLSRGILAEVTDAVEKIGAADRMISALCKAPGVPGARAWAVSADARTADPDYIIGEALTAAQVTIYGLLGALERMAEQIHRMKMEHEDSERKAQSD